MKTTPLHHKHCGVLVRDNDQAERLMKHLASAGFEIDPKLKIATRSVPVSESLRIFIESQPKESIMGCQLDEFMVNADAPEDWVELVRQRFKSYNGIIKIYRG